LTRNSTSGRPAVQYRAFAHETTTKTTTKTTMMMMMMTTATTKASLRVRMERRATHVRLQPYSIALSLPGEVQ
jgi:hypothetical protein